MFKKIFLVLLTITLAGFLVACKEEKVVTDGARSYWDQFIDQNGGVDDGTTDNNNDDDLGTDKDKNVDDGADTGDDQNGGNTDDGENDDGSGQVRIPTITARGSLTVRQGKTEILHLSKKLENYSGDYDWQYSVKSGSSKIRTVWRDNDHNAIEITGLSDGASEIKITALTKAEILITEKNVPITIVSNSPEEKTRIDEEININTTEKFELVAIKGSGELSWKTAVLESGDASGISFSIIPEGNKNYLEINAAKVGDYKIKITARDEVLNIDFGSSHEFRVVADFAVNAYEMRDNKISNLQSPMTVEYGSWFAFVADRGGYYDCKMVTTDSTCNARLGVYNGDVDGLRVACVIDVVDQTNGMECNDVNITISKKYGVPREIHYEKLTFKPKPDPCATPIKVKLIEQHRDPAYDGEKYVEATIQNNGNLSGPFSTDNVLDSAGYLNASDIPISVRKGGTYYATFEVEGGGTSINGWNAQCENGVTCEIVQENTIKMKFIFQDKMSDSKSSPSVVLKSDDQCGNTSFTFNFVINQCRLRNVATHKMKMFVHYGTGDSDTNKGSSSAFFLKKDGNSVANTRFHHIDSNGSGVIDDWSPEYTVDVDVQGEEKVCLEDITSFEWYLSDTCSSCSRPNVHIKRFLVATCSSDIELENIESIIKQDRSQLTSGEVRVNGFADGNDYVAISRNTCFFAGWSGWAGKDDDTNYSRTNSFQVDQARCGSEFWCREVPFGMKPYSWPR